MRCDDCRVNYPDEIISNDLCGICALEMTNRVHGITRTKFTGEMAEEFRLAAIEHRKKIGVSIKYKNNLRK